jgi:hypothetical protein
MKQNWLPDTIYPRRMVSDQDQAGQVHYTFEDDPEFTLCDQNVWGWLRSKKNVDCSQCKDAYQTSRHQAYHYQESPHRQNKRLVTEARSAVIDWLTEAAQSNQLPNDFEALQERVLDLSANQIADNTINRNREFCDEDLKPALLAFLKGKESREDGTRLKRAFPEPQPKLGL